MTLMPVPEWLEKWQDEQSSTEPPRLPKEELLSKLKTTPKSVTVVDIRNEQEKGYITSAMHIPATIINGPNDIQEKFIRPILEQNPKTEEIVIHCNSSAKRASYIGGWAKDHIDQYGPSNVSVEILHEGIVGWLAGDDANRSETTIVAEKI
ncbi:hypothetical protein OXX59_007845 [Metschnikowia pulcherrima]